MRRRTRKSILLPFLILALVIAMGAVAYGAGGWVSAEGGWAYDKSGNGELKEDGWGAIPNEAGDNVYYYFSNKLALSGWQEIDGNTFYFNEDGEPPYLYQNRSAPDGSYLGADGVLVEDTSYAFIMESQLK